MSAVLVSGAGQPIRLGRELASPGAEGAVYEVEAQPDLAAKVYLQPATPEKGRKLAAMAAAVTDRLSRVAAWPQQTLHVRQGGPVTGFLMRRVHRAKDVHVLYGPKTRLREWPDASYELLVRVAANVARGFEVVHAHGHVIGDVNERGILVAPDGTISLVDCDSFQVTAAGRTYSCDVGTFDYQPPELQGVRTFRGLAREPNHDAFGLAVLVFRLLFLARHPYAGRFQGTGEEPPLERRIREFRFAYARDAAARRQMLPPPASLGLETLPAPMVALFERAFLEAGLRGGRPGATEWRTALEDFERELRPCARNAGHSHLKSASKCPLCELEGNSRLLLFAPPRAARVATPLVDLERLWSEVGRVVWGAHNHPALRLVSTLSEAAVDRALSELPPRAEATRRLLQQRQLAVRRLEVSLAERPLRIARRVRNRRVLRVLAGGLGAVALPFAAIGELGAIPLGLVAFGLVVASEREIPEPEDEERALGPTRRDADAAGAKLSALKRAADALAGARREVLAARVSCAQLLESIDKDRRSELPKLAVQIRALEGQLGALRGFTVRRVERLRELEAGRRDRQLERHLDRFEVKDIARKGIGRGHLVTLQSFGIGTAGDVTEENLSLIRGRGIGPVKKAALLAWRAEVAARFSFDPADRADAIERTNLGRALDLEYATKLRQFVQDAELVKGAAAVTGARLTRFGTEFEAAHAAGLAASAAALEAARSTPQ